MPRKQKEEEETGYEETGSMADLIPDGVMELEDPDVLPSGSEALMLIKKAQYLTSKNTGRKMLRLGLTVAKHNVEEFEGKPLGYVSEYISFLRPEDDANQQYMLGRNLRDFCKAFGITPADIRGELISFTDVDWEGDGFASELLVGEECWAILNTERGEDDRVRNVISRWVGQH